jgi:hypothetical protein
MSCMSSICDCSRCSLLCSRAIISECPELPRPAAAASDVAHAVAACSTLCCCCWGALTAQGDGRLLPQAREGTQAPAAAAAPSPDTQPAVMPTAAAVAELPTSQAAAHSHCWQSGAAPPQSGCCGGGSSSCSSCYCCCCICSCCC